MVSSRRRRRARRRLRRPAPLTLPAEVDLEGHFHNQIAPAHQEQVNNPFLLLESVVDEAAHGQSLINAASGGRVEDVEILLSAGADPNYISTNSGWTPLSFATDNAHIDVVRALVAAGADVERRALSSQSWGDEEFTPLQLAIVSNTYTLEDHVRIPGDAVTPGRRRKIVEVLIAGGADPNAKFGSRDCLTLSYALVWGRSRGCLLALMRGGSDVPEFDHEKCTYSDKVKADALALLIAVKKFKSFKRYARDHQRRYGSILEKCFGEGAIPRDVLPTIALFLAPFGGS